MTADIFSEYYIINGGFRLKSKKFMSNFSPGLEKAGSYIVGILAVMFAFFLSFTSLLHTTVVDDISADEGLNTVIYRINVNNESVIYYNDNLFVNLIVLAFTLVLCFLAVKKCSGIRLRYSVSFLFIWTALLGTIWVLSSQSSPTYDSKFVSDASYQFANGDYSALSNNRYFSNYSFQLGYVLFNEIIIRFANLFHPENLLYLEVLNAIFLAVINVFIVLINNTLFNDKRITNLTVILLALSSAPIISCSFIYGIIPGMMFALIAVYAEIRYLKENKIFFAVVSALSIAIAMLIKSNYLIWLIAMMAVAVVYLFKRKKYIRDVIFIAVTLVISMNIQSVAKSIYENRADIDLGDSIPYSSWIAMGLNESEMAPGWYNYYHTISNFEGSNFDADVASERSKKEIKKRIKYFAENPQYTNDFFYLKTVSQWNETSYESIWNNVVRGQFKPKNTFAEWVCNDGAVTVRRIMDCFAQLVFFGFLIGCVYALKKKKLINLFFPLVFIGGFMYQLMSEGKSQYIIPYFILMSGFASYGIVNLLDSGIPSKIKNMILKKEK